MTTEELLDLVCELPLTVAWYATSTRRVAVATATPFLHSHTLRIEQVEGEETKWAAYFDEHVRFGVTPSSALHEIAEMLALDAVEALHVAETLERATRGDPATAGNPERQETHT